MPQRNVASNFTFEQQRVEINELAADFWTQKGVTDTAAGTYLLKDGSNAFTGATLGVPNAFTINSNSGNGTVTIAGNLQVDGTTTTLNSTTLEIADKNLIIAKGGANDAAVDGAGITIDSATDITWNFVDADDAWVSSIGIKSTGPITGNLTGNVTGSVLTAAQTNITSVGTLTGLDVNATDEVTINTDKSSGYIAKFNQDNVNNSAQIEIGSPTDNNTRPVSIDEVYDFSSHCICATSSAVPL